MVEQCYEHGRHAVEARDAFLVYARKRCFGREVGHGAHRGPMGHAGRHGEHHSEAVEHGYLYHHAVRGGKTHAVANTFSVVYNVIVSKHYALGEACGAGGVLHVADVAGLYPGSHAGKFFFGDQRRAAHGFFEG